MRHRLSDHKVEHDLRATVHFFLLVGCMGVYGGQVCPVVESLSFGLWVFHLLVLLAVFRFLRLGASRFIMGSLPRDRQVGSQFFVDLLLLVIAGSGIGVYNMVRYGSGLESTVKLGMGFLMIGFFIATDLGLNQERILALNRGRSSEKGPTRYLSVAKKFLIMTVIALFSVMLIIYFVISLDLIWLLKAGPEMIEAAKRAVLIELGFIIFILTAYSANLILSYAKNLNLFLTEETHALRHVADGDLDTRVPVSFNDEFGLIAGYTNEMIGSLKHQNLMMERLRDVIINSMATLAETRDNETGSHIRRTQHYVKILAEELAEAHGLTEKDVDLIFKTSPLHDIGKVGVPDAILKKSGALTPDETETMQCHTMLGDEALRKAEEQMGEGADTAFLKYAREIAANHHEKWDGSGYPRGLSGEDIPISARVMALADVYDAMRCKRESSKDLASPATWRLPWRTAATRTRPMPGTSRTRRSCIPRST